MTDAKPLTAQEIYQHKEVVANHAVLTPRQKEAIMRLFATIEARDAEIKQLRQSHAALAEGNVAGDVLPCDAVMAVVNQCLISSPQPPAQKDEVMPNTERPAVSRLDNATPLASPLAPGASASESDKP